MSMELLFDREANAKERLASVRTYAAWVKRTPNAEWSRQQALLINSFFENARNMPLSPRDYIERVAGRKKYPNRNRVILPVNRSMLDPIPRADQLLVNVCTNYRWQHSPFDVLVSHDRKNSLHFM